MKSKSTKEKKVKSSSPKPTDSKVKKTVKKSPAKRVAKSKVAKASSAEKKAVVSTKPKKTSMPAKPSASKLKKPVSGVSVAKKKSVRASKAGVKKKSQELKKPSVVEKAKKPIEVKPEAAVSSAAVKQPKIMPKDTSVVNKEKKQADVSKVAPALEPIKSVPAANELELEFPISVKDLAIRLQIKPSRLIQELIHLRILATINQSLSQEDAEVVCQRFNVKAISAPGKEERLLQTHRDQDDSADLRSRPPIITFMGHVDHGKTSLLDAIKKTKIVDVEHGGITQHIGAYEVTLPKGKITLLDTPGHEAFTAMRSRGAHITDIVVLVVAADDGVMPQTIEAIDHSKAAGVPIVVAINKMDKAGADSDQIKRQLSKLGLAPEDWQGTTVTVEVSAKTGQGIDALLDMIILEAEMLELKANYDKPASGVVIESQHDKSRGSLATLLVNSGTLRLNDNLILGLVNAKVKAMFNDHGKRVQQASPGVPVEILGLTGLPEVGEQFFVVSDEKQAREIVALRQEKVRKQQMQPAKKISLEDLHAEIEQGKIKELKVIIKADVVGSLEAVRDSLEKLDVSEVKIQIIHAGVGAINASDAMLAKVANSLILGFHVRPDERAKEIIDEEGIETRTYNVIYELIQELKDAVEGLLEPEIKKAFLGRITIRKVFKLSRSGPIAGCIVNKGKIPRSATVSLIRNGEPIFEGKIANLKRFKDDVRDVAEGFECGISLAGYQDYQEGDIIEAYEIQKIARRL